MITPGPFRERALADRGQRERLDHLLKVTAPNERIFVAGIGAIVAAVLCWLMFGTVTRTVATDGVLIEAGEPAAIVAAAGGRLAAYLVVPGDRVEAGDAIARVAIPPLEARATALRQLVDGLQQRSRDGDAARDLALTLAAARVALVQVEAERVANGTIVSPLAGEVVALRLEPGAWLAAGDAIASVRAPGQGPVSYTHLTLPTKRIV